MELNLGGSLTCLMWKDQSRWQGTGVVPVAVVHSAVEEPESVSTRAVRQGWPFGCLPFRVPFEQMGQEQQWAVGCGGLRGGRDLCLLCVPFHVLHVAQALWLTLSSPTVCFCQAEPLRSHTVLQTQPWGAQAPAPAPRASSAALKIQAQSCRRTSCHLLGLGLPPPAEPCPGSEDARHLAEETGTLDGPRSGLSRTCVFNRKSNPFYTFLTLGSSLSVKLPIFKQDRN